MVKYVKFLFCIYLCAMSYYLYTHQYYNYDIEAYMGLVYKAEYPEMKIEDIHSKVYSELREKNPKHFVYNLCNEEVAKGENTYYKVLAENPKAYEEELELFSVKPFYNFVNSIFFKIGFEASTSTFLVSIICYVFILILIFVFLMKVTNNITYALVISIALSLFKPFLDSSRHASPDNLACFLLLMSLYLMVFNKKKILSLIFAVLCVLTRPEYIVFYTLFYALVVLFANKLGFKRSQIATSYLFVFFTFLGIQYFNKISWTTLFINQFTKVQIYPASKPDPFQFNDYFNYIKSHILLEFNSSYFPILGLFIVIILAKKIRFSIRSLDFYYLFFIVVYACVFVRFLIFPILVNRMMLGYYLIIILSLIYIQFSKIKPISYKLY